MHEITTETGIAMSFDALLANRLALLCGAGLSMAPPSSIPSAAALARRAKEQHRAIFGPDRAELPDKIDDQAEHFFRRGELSTVYLRTYIDRHAFSASPNPGHLAIADFLLVGAITTAVSTNVDLLIEAAGNSLLGQIGVGVTREQIASLSPNTSPLLKIHGCWSDPTSTVWAPSQVATSPTKDRLEECAVWLTPRLLDRDVVIVGYWTDWDYLTSVLETSLGAATPSRVVIVDPCETDTLELKAPALYALGNRATVGFYHVRISGDNFLNQLRVAFSRSFVRRILHAGSATYSENAGSDPADDWLEPPSTDPDVLWRIRRDLEGCRPSEPAQCSQPADEPLLGMTILQLRARGAIPDGSEWNLAGRRVRVLRSPNRPLYAVESEFARETAPLVAPDYVVAVGAEALPLSPHIARGRGTGSIARSAASTSAQRF